MNRNASCVRSPLLARWSEECKTGIHLHFSVVLVIKMSMLGYRRRDGVRSMSKYISRTCVWHEVSYLEAQPPLGEVGRHPAGIPNRKAIEMSSTTSITTDVLTSYSSKREAVLVGNPREYQSAAPCILWFYLRPSTNVFIHANLSHILCESSGLLPDKG